MKPELKLVSEEIVRWAFEVQVHSKSDWNIAFTNPTAGPWKRVTGTNSDGGSGEVHRFEVNEKRPDLILFSDKFRTVVIVEAKTDMKGLADNSQMKKTTELFSRLVTLLQEKSLNPFWANRAQYKYELGLLWGKADESQLEINQMVQDYLRHQRAGLQDLLCIEGQFDGDNLTHRIFWGKSGSAASLSNYQS